jgi:ubiquinol-cytochrome c reductase cytochrome c subunit
MNRFASIACATLAAVLIAGGAGTLSAQPAAPAGDAAHGKQLYDADGCYLCHNYQGQGTGSRKPGQNPGPNLAPSPITYAAFVRQLRTPRTSMPPYDARLLSDKDVADIYAYLAAQPATKDPHSIALLEQVNTGSVPAGSAAGSSGAIVYSQNCAACHGAAGQGGIGPALKGESARKDAAAVASYVKNPAPPMPKLFPGALSENDVAAVSAYVQTLH